MAEKILVPPAVHEELAEGLAQGINLPEISNLPWIRIRSPAAAFAGLDDMPEV
ncbi:MAG: hypothetical protein JW986_05060 [Methanotrichaceae archaeon]|nr:hypothetical protein [Methanotrichaceae archaeon]